MHQNTDNRNPISTYDGLPTTMVAKDEILAEPIAKDTFADSIAADLVVVNALAADSIPSIAAIGTGGFGGSGDSGSNGNGSFQT